MKSHSSLALVLFSILILSGCSSLNFADKERERKAKTFAPKKGMSNIYIYRDYHFGGGNARYAVSVDGSALGELGDATFFQLQVPPGTHVVTSKYMNGFVNPESKLIGNTEAGKNYFFIQSRVFLHTYFSQTEEATGRKDISECSMLSIPDKVMHDISTAAEAAATQRQQAAILPNFAPQNKIVPPNPIVGNHGKYMSPFSASGSVVSWAQERPTEYDNGSDLAASVGSAVGRQLGKQALNFVPFGLGGYVGDKLGESAGRAAMSNRIEPELPSMATIRASSNISFNSVDELAVYLYVNNSSHIEYPRVLSLTQKIYPDLQQVYVAAIQKASKKRIKTN